jgi:hypothetical protein
MAGDVVGVGVAGEQDLDVGHLEAQRLHGFADQRNGLLKAAVDQNVALRRRDEIASRIKGGISRIKGGITDLK